MKHIGKQTQNHYPVVARLSVEETIVLYQKHLLMENDDLGERKAYRMAKAFVTEAQPWGIAGEPGSVAAEFSQPDPHDATFTPTYARREELSVDDTIVLFQMQFLRENKGLSEERAYELAKEFVTTKKPWGEAREPGRISEFSQFCRGCCCW